MTRVVWLGLVALLGGCAAGSGGQASLDRIQNIVVIYAENHSFDNMYGLFPGANGIANATAEQ
jgi:phospholipase C